MKAACQGPGYVSKPAKECTVDRFTIKYSFGSKFIHVVVAVRAPQARTPECYLCLDVPRDSCAVVSCNGCGVLIFHKFRNVPLAVGMF